MQQFLAQSLTLNLQTGRQRSIVVAPQRMPSARQAQSMAEALTALQDGNWSESQDLTACLLYTTSRYPASLRKQELPRAAFEQIADTQEKLDNFKVILANESRVVTPFGRAMNREMSTSWRGRTMEATSFRDDVETYLDELTDQVRLIDKSPTKLSGRSATIPVTVQNNLVQGVDHLVLRLTSLHGDRPALHGGRTAVR